VRAPWKLSSQRLPAVLTQCLRGEPASSHHGYDFRVLGAYDECLVARAVISRDKLQDLFAEPLLPLGIERLERAFGRPKGAPCQFRNRQSSRLFLPTVQTADLLS
jgi:hypothetical protein